MEAIEVNAVFKLLVGEEIDTCGGRSKNWSRLATHIVVTHILRRNR